MEVKTSDFTLFEAVEWIYNNNPGLVSVHNNNRFHIDGIISTVSQKELILPEGWYFSKKNLITNKHNSYNGKHYYIIVIYA